jgi:hypothetical protein
MGHVMNRHDRRRARSQARHNRFYHDYVRHLPTERLDAPLMRGRVYHLAIHHDAPSSPPLRRAVIVRFGGNFLRASPARTLSCKSFCGGAAATP